MKTRKLILGLALSLAVGPLGNAASISLVNPSFEDDDIAANSYTSASTRPTGWSGGAGSSYIADGAIFDGAQGSISGAHTGDQYVVLGNAGANLRQYTGLSWSGIQVGDVLTISAWVTGRSNLANNTNITFWINDSNGSGLNSSNAGTIDGPASRSELTPGTWSLTSWSYTVTEDFLDAAIAGNWGTVEIGFGQFGGSSTRQLAFDDISFTHTPVPEPSAVLSGLLAGGLLLRRRRC